MVKSRDEMTSSILTETTHTHKLTNQDGCFHVNFELLNNLNRKEVTIR